jgi:aryl-alcohol dehydrogenase-like predicted oxidoreductase
MDANDFPMVYRYLGNSGLKVSILSLGTWLADSNSEEGYILTRDLIKRCYEAGVNYYDTAELYGQGGSELLLGRAIKELNIRREELVISTKLIKCGMGVNDCFLSRKHIVEGIKNSL